MTVQEAPREALPKFSDASRRILARAGSDGLSMSGGYVGPEDLFFALLCEGFVQMRSIGLGQITPDNFIEGLNKSFSNAFGEPPHRISGKNKLSPETKKAIRSAVDFARQEGASEITPQHLIKGILIDCFLVHPEEGSSFVEDMVEILEVNFGRLLVDTETLTADEVREKQAALTSHTLHPSEDVATYLHYNRYS